MPHALTRDSRLPRRPLSFLLVLIGSFAACDDPTGPDTFPPPEGPANPLRVSRVVSSLTPVPGQQSAEFTWEGERLVGYRFDPLLGDEIDATIRKEFLYHADGRRMGHDTYVRQDDGSWWLTGALRYAYGARPGLPIEAQRESVDEDGDIVVSIVGFGYDEHGRLTEVRDGPEIDTFRYDRAGDVAQVRSDDIRFGVQVQEIEYGDAWNPFADFPPLAGVDRGIFAPDGPSLHLATGWENAVEGEPPAAVADAVIERNEHDYPVRREWQLRNTTDPDVVTTIVAEYEYVDP